MRVPGGGGVQGGRQGVLVNVVPWVLGGLRRAVGMSVGMVDQLRSGSPRGRELVLEGAGTGAVGDLERWGGRPAVACGGVRIPSGASTGSWSSP